jgi:AcrR family transcriptional regulator
LGRKGRETRQRIVEASLAVFATRGYHATVLDDLAAAAGLSRAGLYQYFGGKDDIFVELVETTGRAPHDEGYRGLRSWLERWVSVFDHFETAFVQWADADSPNTFLRPRMAAFVTSHTELIADALRGAGADVDPLAGATVIDATVSRFLYICATHDVGFEPARRLDSLAITLQRMLFPTTPEGVVGRPPLRANRLPTPLQLDEAPEDRFIGLSAPARATALRLLDVAAEVFADVGPDGASIELIARAAKVTRGAVYNYYASADDLFGAVAARCGREMTERCVALAALDPADGVALRSWLAGFLDQHRRDAGVLRSWTRGTVPDPRVSHARDEVLRTALHAFTAMRSSVPTRDRPDHDAAGLLFVACLERAPELANTLGLDPARVIDAQALLIERGLLGLPEASAR